MVKKSVTIYLPKCSLGFLEIEEGIKNTTIITQKLPRAKYDLQLATVSVRYSAKWMSQSF